MTNKSLKEKIEELRWFDEKRTQGIWKVSGQETGSFLADKTGSFLSGRFAYDKDCHFAAKAPLMMQVINELWTQKELLEHKAKEYARIYPLVKEYQVNNVALKEKLEIAMETLNDINAVLPTQIPEYESTETKLRVEQALEKVKED